MNVTKINKTAISATQTLTIEPSSQPTNNPFLPPPSPTSSLTFSLHHAECAVCPGGLAAALLHEGDVTTAGLALGQQEEPRPDPLSAAAGHRTGRPETPVGHRTRAVQLAAGAGGGRGGSLLSDREEGCIFRLEF